jgi:hypothetical protein
MIMAWAINDILPGIVNARDAGLTRAQIEKKLAKEDRGKLSGALRSLIDAKEIRGPIKRGPSQYYFASGRGPSAEVTCEIVSKLVLDSGTKLLSLAALKKTVTGLNGRFFTDGVRLAIASKKIIQLSCGASKYHFHFDVAQDYFALSKATRADPPRPSGKQSFGSELTMQTIRPVLQRLKAEQGGLGTIDIYDLMKALGVPKDTLHQFLVKEVKAGHLTIHPTTTIQLRPEVIDAAIRLPGFAEPFVTVALKDEL